MAFSIYNFSIVFTDWTIRQIHAGATFVNLGVSIKSYGGLRSNAGSRGEDPISCPQSPS